MSDTGIPHNWKLPTEARSRSVLARLDTLEEQVVALKGMIVKVLQAQACNASVEREIVFKAGWDANAARHKTERDGQG